MTLEEFERFMLSKSSGRTITPNQEMMAERIWSGLKKIAHDTIPLILTVQDSQGYTIIRRIDENTYIRKPEKPLLNTGAGLDIDEVLLDALAFYVLAGLELQRSKVLMGMYWGEIDTFNSILTETHLSVATNDSRKFYVFP